MEYNFIEIEKKWQNFWKENQTFKAVEDPNKEKFYVLDMFPYPSGAGLHVGHPLGYIASDIYARYKRQKGYSVLHPMGYDSFGLPAEQYAIQTGQHPAITTQENIARYRGQLDAIGFSFDWSREVRTSSPDYYKWTQWIFAQLFNAYYDNNLKKAASIDTLISTFEKEGNTNVNATHDCEFIFTAQEWNSMSDKEKSDILMHYRLAYLADSMVNWCPALGTVLANDEIVNGVSERGGHPVIQKKMTQWSMRISAYAERLLKGLNDIDWSDSIKEQQKNWIGKSTGASVFFDIENHNESQIEVFTTRPDTIFGVSFMVLAPEHELVNQITTSAQKDAVQNYVKASAKKSERERQADVKTISGVFTGAYAKHPFTGKNIPIWIGDYVLASYGTGAVMAVPCGDQRDWSFAKHFDIAIINIFKDTDISEGACEDKNTVITDSDFLNDLKGKEAQFTAIKALEEKGIGKSKTNYRLRDAVFSRQRYWGEPFPVYYKNEIPYILDETKTVTLPEVDKYLPTEDGEPPLARAKQEAWNVFEGDRMEYNTMPGWAGSSWYFFRYMDAQNPDAFAAKDKLDYWQNVDLYIGGSEHATGHLLYARFWTKFLADMGFVQIEEPFKKLINQGMILGRSSFVYRIKGTQEFVSAGLKGNYEVDPIHVDIAMVDNDVLDTEAFKAWRSDYANATFILEDGKYICGHEVEKMSKSKFNVQTPDELVEKFGADTLRCYEMFLGPLEQAKPWDTKGISGVHNFLRKYWRLSHQDGVLNITDEAPSKAALKTLHTVIKKVNEDLERYSFNTVVSALMIAVNELTEQKCNNKTIIEGLTALLAPYAPHIAEEVWQALGHDESISTASFPIFDAKHLEESEFTYPVSFNGKMRFKLELPVTLGKEEIEKIVMEHENAQKWLEGKTPKKVIIVPKKIVNIVV